MTGLNRGAISSFTFHYYGNFFDSGKRQFESHQTSRLLLINVAPVSQVQVQQRCKC